MEIIITWREFLVAVVLATIIYLLEPLVFSRWRRQVPRAGDQEVGPELDKLRAEMATLQHRLVELEMRQGMADQPEVDPGHAAYDYAVQYARQGMIAPEIAARCGISRDEAALIVAMHHKGREP